MKYGRRNGEIEMINDANGDLLYSIMSYIA